MTSNELLNNGKLVRVSIGLNIETPDGRMFWSQQVRGKGVSFSAVNRQRLTLMAVWDACGNVITALRKILHHKDAQDRGVILLGMHLSSLDFVREDKDMNTSKKPSIIATVTSAIAVAVFTASAHAELLVGMSFSYGHKELESTYYDMSEAVVALESIQTDNNGNVDVFGQWRSDGKSLFGAYPGVHFGVGQSTGEYFERIDFPDRTGGRVDSEIKQGNTFDLLGVMVWDGVTVWDDDKVKDKVEFIVRPYIMLGFTAVELDITATVEGGGFGNPDALNKGRMMDEENIILTGYKAVAGVELGNLNWIFHAAIQYVNYGSKETFLISDIVSDVANSRTRNFFNRSRYGLIEKFGIRLGVSYIF